MNPLYSKPIRGLVPTRENLRAIAHFNRIVMNYIKMRQITHRFSHEMNDASW